MQRETLALRGKILGKEHPSRPGSMSSLAEVLGGQGKYAEAEVMYRETPALREKIQGKKHPDTLRSMNYLALALIGQGKYAEGGGDVSRGADTEGENPGKGAPRHADNHEQCAQALSPI